MRVLVTGGQGFIGQYVVETLLERRHKPITFDRRLYFDTIREGVEAELGDVRNSTSVHAAMEFCDGWIHLAGLLGTQETVDNPIPAVETNVIGGLNMLQAARQYMRPGVNIAVGNWFMDNPYSISKHTVERFCFMYASEHGLPVSVVRAYNAYGPRQKPSQPYGSATVRKIIPAFVCRALVGQPIEIYGDGEQVMDMVHARDVAGVLVHVLERTAEHRPAAAAIEAGTGEPTTVKFIAQAVADEVSEVTGKPPVPITYLPMRPGEPQGSAVLATNPYGGPHMFTPLAEGLKETVLWYLTQWLPRYKGHLK